MISVEFCLAVLIITSELNESECLSEYFFAINRQCGITR